MEIRCQIIFIKLRFWTIHELETFGTRKRILQKKNWRGVAVSESVQSCFELSSPCISFFPRTIFPHFSNILRKHFNILLCSDRCRDVFKHPPIVAYRRTSNLRDTLVKAQLPAITAPNSTNLPPGSFRCGQDCATCPYITNGLKHYTFSSTGETRNITSHITCKTKNLIYMVQCNRCHLQYIGETKAPSTLMRFRLKTRTFFIHFRLPSTLIRSKTEVYVYENGGFRKRSLEWRFLKTEVQRLCVDGRKRRFSKTITSLTLTCPS